MDTARRILPHPSVFQPTVWGKALGDVGLPHANHLSVSRLLDSQHAFLATMSTWVAEVTLLVMNWSLMNFKLGVPRRWGYNDCRYLKVCWQSRGQEHLIRRHTRNQKYDKDKEKVMTRRILNCCRNYCLTLITKIQKVERVLPG